MLGCFVLDACEECDCSVVLEGFFVAGDCLRFVASAGGLEHSEGRLRIKLFFCVCECFIHSFGVLEVEWWKILLDFFGVPFVKDEDVFVELDSFPVFHDVESVLFVDGLCAVSFEEDHDVLVCSDGFSVLHSVVGSQGCASSAIYEDDVVVEMESVFCHDILDIGDDIYVEAFLVTDVAHDDCGKTVVLEGFCGSCHCRFEDFSEVFVCLLVAGVLWVVAVHFEVEVWWAAEIEVLGVLLDVVEDILSVVADISGFFFEAIFDEAFVVDVGLLLAKLDSGEVVSEVGVDESGCTTGEGIEDAAVDRAEPFDKDFCKDRVENTDGPDFCDTLSDVGV